MPPDLPRRSERMLERYLEIETVARQMLQEARTSDWSRVALRGRAIRALADRLRADLDRLPLNGEQRRERLVIARRLIRIDADIRRLADPGSQALDALFDPARPDPGNAQRPQIDRR